MVRADVAARIGTEGSSWWAELTINYLSSLLPRLEHGEVVGVHDGVDPVPVLGTRRPSATTSPSRDFTAADASTRRHFVDR